MAATFKFWTSSGMTTEHSGTISTDTNGTFVFWFGSTDATRQVQASSAPGVDPITVTPTDSSPSSGHDVNDIELSDDNVTWTTNNGSALSLPVTISGGAGNAVPIYVRLTDRTSGGIPSTELSLVFNTLVETSI